MEILFSDLHKQNELKNETTIFTNSSRHNQWVSLLTEIDDTIISEDSSPKQAVSNDEDNLESQNIITEEKEEKEDEEEFSITDNALQILQSIDDPSQPDSSDNLTSSSSDMFSDSSSSSSNKAANPIHLPLIISLRKRYTIRQITESHSLIRNYATKL